METEELCICGFACVNLLQSKLQTFSIKAYDYAYTPTSAPHVLCTVNDRYMYAANGYVFIDC